MKRSFNNARRTEVQEEEIGEETPESLIPQEDAIVTLSQRGYVKRVPPNTFRQQNRGGKGVRGMTTREGDAILDLLVVDTHSTLFFFTNRGGCTRSVLSRYRETPLERRVGFWLPI